MQLEQRKYPIGKFEKPEPITEDHLQTYIQEISNFPNQLRKAVKDLNNDQLNMPYRKDGWTIRQVVHHCADSHMNGLIRVKLTLTENKPTIKPYLEAVWAELPDSQTLPIEVSLKMLDGIHERWAFVLNHLTPEQWKRTFIHPEHGKEFRLDENTGMYAWHGKHHLAHITSLISRRSWK